MAANEKWLAELKAYVKGRNERIAAQFAELRKTHKARSNSYRGARGDKLRNSSKGGN